MSTREQRSSGWGKEGGVGWEGRVDMRGGRVWEERMLSIIVHDWVSLQRYMCTVWREVCGCSRGHDIDHRDNELLANLSLLWRITHFTAYNL